MGSNKKAWLFKDLKHFQNQKEKRDREKWGGLETAKRNLKNNGIKLCQYKIKTSRYMLQKILHFFHFYKELRIQEIIRFKNNQEETWDVKENIFKHFLYVSVIYRR